MNKAQNQESADRDLLKWAAKAAGIELIGPVEKFIVQFDECHRGGFIIPNNRGGESAWNPLTDDGDALRLAVKLNMSVVVKTLPHAVYVEAYNGQAQAVMETLADVREKDFDPYAARRRAIVRAAAEIGKAMP